MIQSNVWAAQLLSQLLDDILEWWSFGSVRRALFTFKATKEQEDILVLSHLSCNRCIQ